jgi:MFS family permease
MTPGEQDAPLVTRRASPWHLLAHRNFGPYFVGNLVSNCGTWFQNIAQALLIYRLTHSAFLVGLGNFSQFIGVVLLAPVAGPAADRWDRRRLLIVTQVGSTLLTAILAALTATGRATTPAVLLFALALGLLTAFAIPALQALIPNLVERNQLGAAIALISVTFNVARAIGPVIGVLVVAHLGIAAAFALNSISYLALIAALFSIRIASKRSDRSSSVQLRHAIRVVRRDVRLVALLGVVAVVAFTIDPVSTLTPSFATRILGRSDVVAGYLIGAFGSGAVVAALLLMGSSFRRHIEVMVAVTGSGIALFGLSTVLPVGMLSLFIAGIGYLAAETAATTEVQLSVEENQRGRIMAIWTIAFLGIRPVASLVDGSMASTVGIRPAALVMAFPAILMGLGLAIYKKVARIDRVTGSPPRGRPK